MSNPIRTRMHLESLDDRITPSGFDAVPRGFTGLDVAVERFAPVDPCRCLEVAPVFALNYTPNPSPIDELRALNGLIVADSVVPPNPVSPVFFGLAGLDGGGSVDTPA